jgi:poly(3-hydroxybutyrate) depolymerase
VARIFRSLAHRLGWLAFSVISPIGISAHAEAGGTAGRLLWGTCYPLCLRAGAEDWGYEEALSCIAPASSTAALGEPCALPPLGPEQVEPRIPTARATRPASNHSTGFFVDDGRLYDSRGSDFIARGVNLPLAWYQTQSIQWLNEVASTGANSVRLVWQVGLPLPVLRAAIARAIELDLVPMVELHDATGAAEDDALLRLARYYAEDARAILLEFEQHLLVNIANEWSGEDGAFVGAYRAAIDLMRAAGLRHTLVIDANAYGQRAQTLLTYGSELLALDPEHNLLFSAHFYEQFARSAHVERVLRAAVAKHLPFVVGEFGTPGDAAPASVLATPALLAEAERLGIGHWAWVWTGYGDGPGSLDLSTSGSAADLTPWGQLVINGTFGIRSTSRPAAALLPEPVPDQGPSERNASALLATTDGQEHRYYHIPHVAAPSGGRPVLLWLHGDGGNGQSAGSSFYRYTDPSGAIVIGPDGTNGTWTHAASDLPGQPQEAQFLSALIDQLVTTGVDGEPVNPRRIYVGGESRGAFMPYYLLMRASTRERIAAVAVNAGLLYCQPGDAECEAGQSTSAHRASTPILHLHGTNDAAVAPAPLARFHNPVDWSQDWRVFYPMKLWAQQNGCFGGDNSTRRDSGVLRQSWRVNGRAAARYDLSAWGRACSKYQLILVNGGGHVIAGQEGRIWEFLRQHELPVGGN